MTAHAVHGMNGVYRDQVLRLTSAGQEIREAAPPPTQQIIMQPPPPPAARQWMDEREVMPQTMFATSPMQEVHTCNMTFKEGSNTDALTRQEEEHRQQGRRLKDEYAEGKK